jgi:hypothetical protein
MPANLFKMREVEVFEVESGARVMRYDVMAGAQQLSYSIVLERGLTKRFTRGKAYLELLNNMRMYGIDPANAKPAPPIKIGPNNSRNSRIV